MALAASQKRSLRRLGHVVVPRLVPRARLDPALREINHRVGLGRPPDLEPYADSRDYWSFRSDSPCFLDLFTATPLAALCESLLGAGRVIKPRQAQIALRFPAAARAESGGPALHVDGLADRRGPGSGVAVTRFAMLAGVLLSDAPRPDMGNLTVSPGSHELLARQIRGRGTSWLRGGLEGKLRLPAPAQILGRAGDVVLCHYLLAHDREVNLSPRIRYMAYFRVYHMDHRTNGDRPLSDPWMEWPGLR